MATVVACGGDPTEPLPNPATMPTPTAATATATATTTASPTATADPTATASPIATVTPTARPSPSPAATVSPTPAPATATPTPDATAFRYDAYDTTGVVATPGSYAFLADADDPLTAVTTYEGLRDGTATALLIHTSDADGIQRAGVYDAVEVGDLFEWRKADDCFVRYTVTEVKPDPIATAPRKLLAVEWMTYAFTGCSGPIPANTDATVDWGELPDLGGTSLTAPVIHGVYQITPAGWTGVTKTYYEEDIDDTPAYDNPVFTRNLAEARKLPHWRDPDLPAGVNWVFDRALSGGLSTPAYGYSAYYLRPDGQPALTIEGYRSTTRYYAREASRDIRRPAAWGRATMLSETRVIAGRPAHVFYSPAGDYHGPRAHAWLLIYDKETNTEYNLNGDASPLEDVNVLIAIAESLFDEQAPLTPPSAKPDEPAEPDPTHRRALPTSPTYAAPPGVYSAIAVGTDHACALSEDGEAVCWDIESAEMWDAPPGSYRFITAEGGDTCSVAEGGEVACLSRGEDPWTPLGEGTRRYVVVVDDCGLTAAGAIECWGGYPRLPDPPSEPLVAINGLMEIQGFGTTYYRRCALTATGDIVCWGTDTLSSERWSWRQSGDYVALAGFGGCGLTTGGHWDCLPPGVAADGRYVAISTTGRHHCAIARNGKAVCGPVRRLVEGEVARMIPPDPSPERFVAISVGESPDWERDVDLVYACALTDSGRVVCWANEPNRIPRPETTRGPYIAVSDGLGHTCVLTTAREAVCWGWNNFGQADVPLGRYTAVSAGHVATCAVTEAGEAVCWGDWAPELPPGSYVDISTGYYEACALTDEGEVVCGVARGMVDGLLGDIPPGPFDEVSFRWTHACARAEAGDLVCWGIDGAGATEVPQGRYLAVSVHYSSTCAIADTGEAACWGWLTEVAPSGTYVAISAGERHACALTEAGEAACWGSWAYGAVTPPPGEYTALSSSSFRACALTVGGEVVCWGDEGYQQRPWFSPE